eukprot:gene36-3432_t
MSTGRVQLGDLNDFISPSQACIKPVEINREDGKPAKIAIEPDGTYTQVQEDGSKIKLEKAKITLNDCLACSGCVTSAESVLIEKQNHQELLKAIEEKSSDALVCVCMSQQSYSSLAVRFNLTAIEACKRLVTFFKSLGVDYVFDVSIARSLALRESGKEFVRRLKNERENGALPIITSACPGWICYAEKTRPETLPYISNVKSPQQIMGSLIKYHFASRAGILPEKVFVVSVMPCFDKKLEASRQDFYSDLYRTRDIDCVIVSHEVETMLEERRILLQDLSPSSLDCVIEPGRNDECVGHVGSSSGGYLHHVLAYATRELYGIKLDSIEMKTRRGEDYKDTQVFVNDKVVLRFATAYGFRNIQNMVRRLRQQKCPYQYIEIMACPKGCVNGGGQIRHADPSMATETPVLVEQEYLSVPQIAAWDDERVAELLQALQSRRDAGDAQALSNEQFFSTQYHHVETTIIPQFESW